MISRSTKALIQKVTFCFLVAHRPIEVIMFSSKAWWCPERSSCAVETKLVLWCVSILVLVYLVARSYNFSLQSYLSKGVCPRTVAAESSVKPITSCVVGTTNNGGEGRKPAKQPPLGTWSASFSQTWSRGGPFVGQVVLPMAAPQRAPSSKAHKGAVGKRGPLGRIRFMLMRLKTIHKRTSITQPNSI